MRRTVLLLASTALAVLLVSGVALVGVQERAQASFPGLNGRIAVADEGGIFTVNPDGSGQAQLTGSGGYPSWSPDGTKIAFSDHRGGRSEIYVMNADGSNPTRITDTPTAVENDPSWSPDGKRIAFALNDQIWTSNVDGTNQKMLGRGSWPDWSPDGTRIAFTDDWQGEDEWGNVYTMSTDGTNRTRVYHGYSPDWSPDGTKLAIKDLFGEQENMGIFTVGADGSGYTDTFPMDGETWVGRPVWSPDGAKVAFGMDTGYLGDDGNYEQGIAVSNPDGSDLSLGYLASGAPQDIDWGPKPVDSTAPTVKAPTRNLVAASVIADSAVPVSIAWSASDPTSGVARYEVQQSTNGGAFADVALPTETATSITPSLEAGKTYQYQVRAQDWAGNWSAWRPGPSFAVDLRQETHQAITYSGTWALQSAPTASGGYVRHASVSGARAKFSFAGKHVAWVASTGSNRGKAEVWVDGVKVKTVDLYSPSAQPRRMVFTKAWSASANHTVEVRALGTKNAASTGARVDVDAFVALR